MEDIVVMGADDAMRALQTGNAPARLRVEGSLHFYAQHNILPPLVLPSDELVAHDIIIHDASQLTHWPRAVRCKQLFVWKLQIPFPSDALLEILIPAYAPDGWRYTELNLTDCPRITRLPELRGDALLATWIYRCAALEELPAGMDTARLELSHCPRLTSLPADLRAQTLEINGCPQLVRLPSALHAQRVLITDCTELTTLPDDVTVSEELTLMGCANLRRLPDAIDSTQFSVAGCRSLTRLPNRLRSQYINLAGCTGLVGWNDPDITTVRQLSARGCTALETLPPHLRQIDELDVRGCVQLTALPEELRIARWIDVAESGLRALPASAQGAQVRWNGVNVTGQIAFHPETLSAQQALSAENAELRRVMVERIGSERFIAEANPQQLDTDVDRGGMRRLLRVEIPDDEPWVALEVRDPSTGRMYLLRVPPEVDTCRQAAAWIAGFGNPDEYQPVMET